MADLPGEPVVLAPPAFVLVPLNKEARKAVRDAKNQQFPTFLVDESILGFYISFENADKQEFTLGRSGTDIHLPGGPGTDISKHQCSFVCNEKTGAVLLVDHSTKDNTEPFSSDQGGQTIPFHNKRSILVARGINGQVAFGKNRFYQFRIRWHSDGLYDFPNKNEPYSVGPVNMRKKYLLGSKIGGGAYGTVWWALDITSGEMMAMKSFNNLTGKHFVFAKREVDNLYKINRSDMIRSEIIPPWMSHIIEILDHAGEKPGDNLLEIMMPLKQGNLRSLAEGNRDLDLSQLVLRQMLLALRCLAQHELIHRDVKPENILWEFDSRGRYHFRLADFGLSHDPTLAITIAGTETFMAPEVLNKENQTEKVDIWSLFATIVWVKDVDNFQRRCSSKGPHEIHRWLVNLSKRDELMYIGAMANLRPSRRPSAKELLKTLKQLSAASYDPDAELADAMQTGLTMGDDDGGGDVDRLSSGSTNNYGVDDGGNPLLLPHPEYYEPYSFDGRNLVADGDDYSPQRYYPATAESRPRGGRRNQAYVEPYEPAYGLPEGSTSGTAVPDRWTVRPLPTQDTEAGQASGDE
ncbi:kinase-like protein [Phialemonium atrogriseum]|uniref:Kinase-like protein n=1 Tax=Phialemonium atrogriseum TaxID=1093897 RepID=A0AAJ0CCR7_9PEZI|nr:kinase-like protein [Phialemonium atrogriseum]KAK1772882.1 kinase-like protein [Phialemonium atrogriseum]